MSDTLTTPEAEAAAGASAVLHALDEAPLITPPTVNGVEQRLVAVPTAAAMVGVSARTVWRWVADGRVRGLKLGGATRIPIADLNAMLAESA